MNLPHMNDMARALNFRPDGALHWNEATYVENMLSFITKSVFVVFAIAASVGTW